jgi:hypothetical protein
MRHDSANKKHWPSSCGVSADWGTWGASPPDVPAPPRPQWRGSGWEGQWSTRRSRYRPAIESKRRKGSGPRGSQ